MSAITESLEWRRAVRRFDPARIISAETWQVPEQSLGLSPSSCGAAAQEVLCDHIARHQAAASGCGVGPDSAAGLFAFRGHRCIALGFLLETAAMLRVDACPTAGIRPERLDGLLAISGTPWTSVVACAPGYRSADDQSAAEARVRFEPADVVVHC
ncbi:MAG: hypothetical protein ACKO2P_11435 [Planctomycetota bacterium]